MVDSRTNRYSKGGVEVVTLAHGEILEASITVHVNGQSELEGLLEEARDTVEEHGLTILRQDVFGTPAEHDTAPEMLSGIFGAVDWPVSWLEEGDSLGERLTGTHLYAIRGADVRRLTCDNRVVGSVFSDEDAEYCYLGGIVSGDLGLGRAPQTRDVLERIERFVRMAGMDFRHVMRTWFYNDHILDWYDDFNSVRTAFFNERGVFNSLVPASTGIGGGNVEGAALIADALAIKPLARGGDADPVTVFEVTSPLQCPATSYRSSFARAVEVAAPEHRRLYVSGTASIEPGGATAHVGDFRAQVELTLDVVSEILKSRDMGWQDVCRAIAYIKTGKDLDTYIACMHERGLSNLPTVVTENDICRHNLLFELEVDAIAETR